MNRRKALLLSAAGLAGVGMAGMGAALRLHRTPRQMPFLTPAHLAGLASTDLARPRVLFVGNSMVLNNDLPAAVRAVAAADGVRVTTATAAAGGARLIETVRIDTFDQALDAGWDAIVVQDFTKTPLRAIDRWASARAIARIAKLGAPAPLLLYPPWPAAPGNIVYRDSGFMTATPSGPRDFAARAMAFYESLGHPVAPVPDAWLDAVDAGADLYADDGHHPNPEGTDFVARILWDSLKPLIR